MWYRHRRCSNICFTIYFCIVTFNNVFVLQRKKRPLTGKPPTCLDCLIPVFVEVEDLSSSTDEHKLRFKRMNCIRVQIFDSHFPITIVQSFNILNFLMIRNVTLRSFKLEINFSECSKVYICTSFITR